MDVLTSETCSALNKVIIKQVASSWSLFTQNVRISVYRTRDEDLVQFFKMERGLAACTDTDGLMQTLNINHNPLDW